MGDVLSPITVSPPPAPSSPTKSNILMLYYGLVVVGTAAIALALYNYLVIKRCSRRHVHRPEIPNGLVEVVVGSSTSTSSENHSQRNLLSSFKYKKEKGEEGEKQKGSDCDHGDENYECPICLSGFEEGEEVRKLPGCKHSFHAQCIDMWLYSHFDCPVCRTPVRPSGRRLSPENSSGGGEGLPESNGNDSVLV